MAATKQDYYALLGVAGPRTRRRFARPTAAWRGSITGRNPATSLPRRASKKLARRTRFFPIGRSGRSTTSLVPTGNSSNGVVRRAPAGRLPLGFGTGWRSLRGVRRRRRVHAQRSARRAVWRWRSGRRGRRRATPTTDLRASGPGLRAASRHHARGSVRRDAARLAAPGTRRQYPPPGSQGARRRHRWLAHPDSW